MLYRIHFGRQPCWRVHPSDPPEVPIPLAPGWSLLSPALAFRDLAWSAPTFLACDEDRTLVYSSDMVFRVPESEVDLRPDRFLPVLKWIRFASGQSTISGEVLGGQRLDDSELNGVVDLFPKGTRSFAVLPHVELTAIGCDVLTAQIQRSASLHVPVYADILLDAIQADFLGDYMKAVLYCAIAVECVAATRLDEEFHHSRRISQDRQGMSQSTVPRPSESDDRYAALRKRARTSFRTLLHDLPEYVLRRSLKVEKPSLHEAVLDLRDTRNKFVHAGIAPDPVEAYGLAKTSFATTLQAFAWFQAAGRFVTKHGQRYGAG